MPQFNYDFPGQAIGAIGTYGTANCDIISVANPLIAQVSNLDIDATTTDGTYAVAAVGTDGSNASASFVAAGLTAAQIAAGVAAAILADPSFRSLVSSATVVATDSVSIVFQQRGVSYEVTYSGPAGPDVTTPTAAGYQTVPLGAVLQADAAGGFTMAYSDGTLGLGIVVRNADFVIPFDGSPALGYTGPANIGLVRTGEVSVRVASGVTVLAGEAAFFNGTTNTWSNVTTGSHVAVIGSQWRTTGTGVQRVFARFPTAAS